MISGFFRYDMVENNQKVKHFMITLHCFSTDKTCINSFFFMKNYFDIIENLFRFQIVASVH